MTVLDNEDPADPSVHEPQPVAYVVWAENGNCILWTTNKAQAQECAAKYERPMRELYDQAAIETAVALAQDHYSDLMLAVEWMLADGGNMTQEHLARIRAAWESA